MENQNAFWQITLLFLSVIVITLALSREAQRREQIESIWLGTLAVPGAIPPGVQPDRGPAGDNAPATLKLAKSNKPCLRPP